MFTKYKSPFSIYYNISCVMCVKAVNLYDTVLRCLKGNVGFRGGSDGYVVLRATLNLTADSAGNI